MPPHIGAEGCTDERSRDYYVTTLIGYQICLAMVLRLRATRTGSTKIRLTVRPN